MHKRNGTVLSFLQESCPSIKNILLLDSDGKRVAVKYYTDDWPTNNAKEAFEKSVFTKTQKTNARTEAEIAMFESNIVVYKFVQDLHFFVTGGEDENELILATVLQGFFDAVGLLLRGNVERKEALENLDLILLCLDEIVDGGWGGIMSNIASFSGAEVEPFDPGECHLMLFGVLNYSWLYAPEGKLILFEDYQPCKVEKHLDIVLETDANVIAGKVASNSMDAGAPLSEQTISQALATAREHLTRSLLK
ncbi:Coatomer subunit zeta-2 [Morella rubra]|uniref:Coatomer subunit zeta n=1 Tax=Morella rubra TaxID=262757 RepID=A0A6A1WCG5_9ROSI|nr:Coatomer subunit zeta-2 [Morella rubra]